MATELTPQGIMPIVTPRALEFPPIADRLSLHVINVPNFQEATLRKVIHPRIEIDQDEHIVSILSQGLSLSEEKRTVGREAIVIEVAARYRRGEGAIKQLYRYLVFQENGTSYCQRLPMGAWSPSDPDTCLEWLGRGGLQQGDFVLLPRKRLPVGVFEIERPKALSFWERTVEGFRSLLHEVLDEDFNASEWSRLIGRHNPVGCSAYRKDNRMYLVAPLDTVVEHPEHAPLNIPAGTYEIVEDRASSYWRKAID